MSCWQYSLLVVSHFYAGFNHFQTSQNQKCSLRSVPYTTALMAVSRLIQLGIMCNHRSTAYYHLHFLFRTLGNSLGKCRAKMERVKANNLVFMANQATEATDVNPPEGRGILEVKSNAHIQLGIETLQSSIINQIQSRFLQIQMAMTLEYLSPHISLEQLYLKVNFQSLNLIQTDAQR